MKKDQTADLLTVFLLASNLAKKEGRRGEEKEYLNIFQEIAAGAGHNKKYSIVEIDQEQAPEPAEELTYRNLYKYAERGAHETIKGILKEIGIETAIPKPGSAERIEQLKEAYTNAAADLETIEQYLSV